MIPFEILEVRLLLAADPTVYEQYMLYLVNRARANPALEAASFGIDLNEGVPPDQLISAAPKQPLAFNGFLNESADAHSLWMLETDIFDHTGINGSDPGDRDAAAGYNFVPPYAWGENIAYSGFYTHLPEPIMTIERLHGNLFVDEGIPDRGHRLVMLNDFFREIGIGIAPGNFAGAQVWMVSQEYATTAGNPFITGVVWADTIDGNGIFSPFEGLGGVTVEATSLADGAFYQAITWDAGGYSLQVPPGQYSVRAYGGDLSSPMEYGTLTIAGENVLADFNASTLIDMPSLTESGVLLIIGTPGDDLIAVQDLGDRVRVVRNSSTIDFAKGRVNAIEIHAGGGDDYIDIGPGLPVAGINGNEGNDTIMGGSTIDYINGGDGDDVINGRFGDDSIDGGDGHDMLFGRAGNDTIFGGKGRDTIYGGNHNDLLYGNNAADQIFGEEGNDTIVGDENFDTLNGGAGDDTFLALDSALDVIDGGDGTDFAEVDPLLDVVVNVEL